MDPNQIWSWILSAVGLSGFFLAGKKVWWAWYVNIANQVLWTFYSFYTQQWGFLAGTAFYLWVFSRNAYLWTKEYLMISKSMVHFEERPSNGEPPGFKITRKEGETDGR